MSGDIRKMIDKVRNFKQFMNENMNDEIFLYHGTSLKNAENIINYGFDEDTYWGDKSTAEQYAYSYNKPVLIRLKKLEILTMLEPNTTLLNFYEDNMDEDEDYKEIIDMWNNSSQTVDESLDILGSVILPPNNIPISNDNIIKI